MKRCHWFSKFISKS